MAASINAAGWRRSVFVFDRLTGGGLPAVERYPWACIAERLEGADAEAAAEFAALEAALL